MEPQRQIEQPALRSREDRRAHHQHHGQRNLNHHQNLSRAANRAAEAASGALQRDQRIRAACSPRRNQTEKHAADDCRRYRKRQHSTVERDVVCPVDIPGPDELSQKPGGPSRAEDAPGRPGAGEQQAFGEILPHHPSAPGAQGHADTRLVLRRLGTREQQRCQVHRRQQQQHPHHGEQHFQRIGEAPAREVEPAARGRGFHYDFPRRIGPRLAPDRFQFGARTGQSDARAEASRGSPGRARAIVAGGPAR